MRKIVVAALLTLVPGLAAAHVIPPPPVPETRADRLAKCFLTALAREPALAYKGPERAHKRDGVDTCAITATPSKLSVRCSSWTNAIAVSAADVRSEGFALVRVQEDARLIDEHDLAPVVACDSIRMCPPSSRERGSAQDQLKAIVVSDDDIWRGFWQAFRSAIRERAERRAKASLESIREQLAHQ